jgi:type VI secretion system secreted protein Hcp
MKTKRKKASTGIASTLLASAFAMLAAVSASNASATMDMFLKLDGVSGDSVDDKHAAEIDVIAWSWAANGELQGAQRATSRSFCPQQFSLTKFVDRSTPVLLTKAAIGESIRNGKLTVRKAGIKPIEYVVITFTDIRIGSFSTGGSGGEDRLTENITFNFGSATVTYTPQKPDSTADSPISSTIGASCL